MLSLKTAFQKCMALGGSPREKVYSAQYVAFLCLFFNCCREKWFLKMYDTGGSPSDIPHKGKYVAILWLVFQYSQLKALLL